jgi:hypothetical protein
MTKRLFRSPDRSGRRIPDGHLRDLQRVRRSKLGSTHNPPLT